MLDLPFDVLFVMDLSDALASRGVKVDRLRWEGEGNASKIVASVKGREFAFDITADDADVEACVAKIQALHDRGWVL